MGESPCSIWFPLSPSLQKKAMFMVHTRQTWGRGGAAFPSKAAMHGNAPSFSLLLQTHPRLTSIVSLKLKQTFAFRRPVAAGPGFVLVPHDPELAGQLGSPGILVLGVLDVRPPCPDPGVKGLCPMDVQVPGTEGLAETSPVLSTYQGPEAQRWTWSSDHASLTQLGLVPLWGPPMASLSA